MATLGALFFGRSGEFYTDVIQNLIGIATLDEINETDQYDYNKHNSLRFMLSNRAFGKKDADFNPMFGTLFISMALTLRTKIMCNDQYTNTYLIQNYNYGTNAVDTTNYYTSLVTKLKAAAIEDCDFAGLSLDNIMFTTITYSSANLRNALWCIFLSGVTDIGIAAASIKDKSTNVHKAITALTTTLDGYNSKAPGKDKRFKHFLFYAFFINHDAVLTMDDILFMCFYLTDDKKIIDTADTKCSKLRTEINDIYNACKAVGMDPVYPLTATAAVLPAAGSWTGGAQFSFGTAVRTIISNRYATKYNMRDGNPNSIVKDSPSISNCRVKFFDDENIVSISDTQKFIMEQLGNLVREGAYYINTVDSTALFDISAPSIHKTLLNNMFERLPSLSALGGVKWPYGLLKFKANKFINFIPRGAVRWSYYDDTRAIKYNQTNDDLFVLCENVYNGSQCPALEYIKFITFPDINVDKSMQENGFSVSRIIKDYMATKATEFEKQIKKYTIDQNSQSVNDSVYQTVSMVPNLIYENGKTQVPDMNNCKSVGLGTTCSTPNANSAALALRTNIATITTANLAAKLPVIEMQLTTILTGGNAINPSDISQGDVELYMKLLNAISDKNYEIIDKVMLIKYIPPTSTTFASYHYTLNYVNHIIGFFRSFPHLLRQNSDSPNKPNSKLSYFSGLKVVNDDTKTVRNQSVRLDTINSLVGGGTNAYVPHFASNARYMIGGAPSMPEDKLMNDLDREIKNLKMNNNNVGVVASFNKIKEEFQKASKDKMILIEQIRLLSLAEKFLRQIDSTYKPVNKINLLEVKNHPDPDFNINSVTGDMSHSRDIIKRINKAIADAKKTAKTLDDVCAELIKNPVISALRAQLFAYRTADTHSSGKLDNVSLAFTDN
jgi:hypothetical protein